ncbi:MAG: hypothetical protein QOD12_853 [Verrucomicrobiota bacterium]|jgi:hypothetical protein
MNPVTSILQEIRTNYSVFEEDQVLTHGQLNTVAEYFEDQTRLTRTKLLGVGIVCGLRVSTKGATVIVSKGAGVTTDGDLLFLKEDTVFDQFRVYDETSPKYTPFAGALKAKKVYELMPRVAPPLKDALVFDLGQFKAKTGGVLDDTFAVLFMEGYVKDEDLCTGTDCDNLGQNFINTIKLLVMDKASADALSKALPIPGQAARDLADVVADRPLITAGIDTTAKLAALYSGKCLNIHKNLTTELAKLDKAFWASLGDRFPSDTATGWVAKLGDIKKGFTTNNFGIQYYYDFLKDLVETYNQFRCLLLADTTWCCPDPESFPKHLLLGKVVAGTDPDLNRTGFYPSPLVSRTTEQLDHAAFLTQKLSSLIQAFVWPVPANLRITPTRFEDASLEERAIPYYYPFDAANPVQQHWSYRLHKQRMDAWNYSYHAAAYKAEGGAAQPLFSQIGPYSFFRVEGFLGQEVSAVQKAIQQEVTDNNLPFIVRAVLLGNDLKKVKKPDRRYTDISRFHYLLRQDTYHHLNEVMQFSDQLKTQVDNAVKDKVITNKADENGGVAPQTRAEEKNAAVTKGATAARAKMNVSYRDYKPASWKADMGDTMRAGGEFKYDLSPVIKTEFVTPFDSLISYRPLLWLDWLDTIIQQKDDERVGKLLFSKFVAEHPGLEHFAGVSRGGTFVLVYDNAGTVIADFTLPYCCCEETAEQPAEPVLEPPSWKPPYVISNGVRINPPLDFNIKEKIEKFGHEVIDPRINVQTDYLNFFKDSWKVMGDVFTHAVTNPTRGNEPKYTDDLLNAVVGETKAKYEKVRVLKEKADQVGLPDAVHKRYVVKLKEAEGDLATSIHGTAQYVSESGMDVGTGSEGFNAMLETSNTLGALSDAGVRAKMKDNFTKLKDSTASVGLKVVLTNMLNF